MKESTERRLLPFFVTRPMWGMIPVRIVFGFTMLVHGASRLIQMRGESGSFVEELPSVAAIIILIIFSSIEFLAGVMIIPGVLARFVGLMILVELTFSIFAEKIPLGFQGNVTVELLLFAIASMLFFSGAGRFSVDRVIARRLIRKFPNKKWEYYLSSEIPHCQHWYE